MRTIVTFVRTLRSLLIVSLLVGTGALGSGSATATILGGVRMNDGTWPLSATNGYAWWSNSGPTVEGMCHLAPNAIDGWNYWSFNLPYTESRWRCVADGRDIVTSGVAVGSTVDFKKLELEQAATLGSGAPNFVTDYPRVITRVRWDLGSDGAYESDTTSGWARDQHGESCAADYRGTWWCWYRAYYLNFRQSFSRVGSFPIELIVNYSDGTTETAAATNDVVPDAVTPSLKAAKPWYLTGEPISLDASGSSAVSQSLSSFAWDLGTGTFGDSGSESTARVTFSTPGTKSVRVRVTSRGGSTAEATAPVDVRPSPPSGELGISINDASPYTNDARVKLRLVWPPGAVQARISNDGGFGASSVVTKDLASSTDWRLDDSVKALYTKVVYVRFSGSDIDETRTYTDDIILDLTPPTIQSATATGLAASAENAKAKGQPVRVRTKAKDNRSGVGFLQVTSKKAKPGKALAYARSRIVRVTGTRVFLRVQDRAGNWSSWRTVQVRR
jgi:hypothetical protein